MPAIHSYQRLWDGPVEVALLDSTGRIVAVNAAWEAFAIEHGGDPARTGFGVSYLAICEAAGDDQAAAAVGAAIREALAGALPGPQRVEIPCDSPHQARQFDVLISSRLDGNDSCVGATVTLSPTLSPGERSANARSRHPMQPFAVGRWADHPASRTGRGALALDERAEAADEPHSVVGRPLAQDRLIGPSTRETGGALKVQDRLRHLLQLNAAIVGGQSLSVVLRDVVTAARELAAAGYAALGVMGPHGDLEQFVHVGMDEQTVRRIGDLPRGRGVLGLLIRHPDPIRLRNLAEHPANVGFPHEHPPMGSFLGVPILVRGELFGNLYLTESRHGEFSAEDEQLIVALAGTAGVAIANARHNEQIRQQQQWLTASTELTQQLFSNSATPPMDVVLEYAMRGADADTAVLAVQINERRAVVRAALGTPSDTRGSVIDLDRSVAGEVIRSGQSIRIDEHADRIDEWTSDEGLPGIDPLICVPVLTRDKRVLGALTVTRFPGRPKFTDADRDHLADFAAHAGVALELDRARAENETLRRAADRDRIAADLHDHVIQEMFSIGMGLQGMINGLRDPEQQARISGYVDSLDSTIRRIRATIFGLQTDSDADGLKLRILAVLDETAAGVGFAVEVDFVGPLDTRISHPLALDVEAVVREAVSNAARHARAGAVKVTVALVDELVTVEVVDNGVGIGRSTRSSGLTNMRRRAESHGGTFTTTTPAGGGTHLRWTAVNP